MRTKQLHISDTESRYYTAVCDSKGRYKFSNIIVRSTLVGQKYEVASETHDLSYKDAKIMIEDAEHLLRIENAQYKASLKPKNPASRKAS